MSNKLLSISVKGNNKQWSFNFYGNTRYINEWREDGLEIDIIENTIPEFINDIGLTKAWVFFQDIINFNNPFR